MQSEPQRLHIFLAEFASRAEATAYTEKQWEAEPGDEVSDEEYQAWEARNPRWRMREESSFTYLDGDFTETIWGDGEDDPGVNWQYLSSLLAPDDVAKCRSAALPGANTLIIIHNQALGGFDFAFSSTPTMTYCGAYEVAQG